MDIQSSPEKVVTQNSEQSSSKVRNKFKTTNAVNSQGNDSDNSNSIESNDQIGAESNTVKKQFKKTDDQLEDEGKQSNVIKSQFKESDDKGTQSNTVKKQFKKNESDEDNWD